jgi:ketosteroid isomerase-like protein
MFGEKVMRGAPRCAAGGVRGWIPAGGAGRIRGQGFGPLAPGGDAGLRPLRRRAYATPTQNDRRSRSYRRRAGPVILARKGPECAGPATRGPQMPTTKATFQTADTAVADLIRLSEDSNAALMRGDIDRYLSLLSFSQDFSLMSPFGGEPTHGRDMTDETMRAMGRFFRNGTFEMEVVQAYGSPDMVALALIERCDVEVGDLPAQVWALRVTLVYRRDGGRWVLIHRHADPLVGGVTHAEAAALAQR